jgi:plastocyanin
MRSIVRLALVGSMLVAAASVAIVGVHAGGGCHGPTGAVPTEIGGTTVIRMDGCTFAPTIDRVAVGTTVTFLNTAQTPHDVTGTRGVPQAWGSPTLEPGASFRHAFAKPGIYPYSCSLHPGMAGVIVAGVAADSAGLVVPEPPSAAAPAEGASGAEPMAAGGAGLALGAVASWLLLRRRAEED